MTLLGMKRRFFKENFRKYTAMSTDGRNRFVLVATCLALMSLVRYCCFPDSTGVLSLQVEYTPVFSLDSQAQNLVTDGQSSVLRQGSDPIVSDQHNVGGNLVRTTKESRDSRGGSTTALCQDRYVYIHSVPREFNAQLLESCHSMKDWSNMCVALTNHGLGPAMRNAEAFTGRGWYETNQFALEVIFHNRLKQYDCLTSDARKASAIYVPFYPGLEAAQTLWNKDMRKRDLNPLRFVKWLQEQPEWEPHRGHDHFMVGGRITWDFRRKLGEEWGNTLLLLPAMQNMTTLVIEANTWATNDVAIPYPTYFHPSSDSDIRTWQEKVRLFERNVLFSFAGGSREDKSIRGQLIDQCRRSPFCKLLSCDFGACQTPQPLMKLFEESNFCLQPQGDSATRRSIFDSMLAGCIPVFFHPHSYSGYVWHFPKNQSEYSVLISEDHLRSGALSVESVLRRISATQIQQMRKTIIELIPKLVYADPRVSTLEQSSDAFDIAMKGVFEMISEKKRAEHQF